MHLQIARSTKQCTCTVKVDVSFRSRILTFLNPDSFLLSHLTIKRVGSSWNRTWDPLHTNPLTIHAKPQLWCCPASKLYMYYRPCINDVFLRSRTNFYISYSSILWHSVLLGFNEKHVRDVCKDPFTTTLSWVIAFFFKNNLLLLSGSIPCFFIIPAIHLALNNRTYTNTTHYKFVLWGSTWHVCTEEMFKTYCKTSRTWFFAMHKICTCQILCWPLYGGQRLNRGQSHVTCWPRLVTIGQCM